MNKSYDTFEELFSTNEREKRNQLKELMKDWMAEVSRKEVIMFHDDNKKYKPELYFGMDGFFPNYFSQKRKILFIGREARDNSGSDLIFNCINELKKDNIYIFWRRILRMYYGIKTNGSLGFDDLPSPNDIVKDMVKSNDYGFAVINISKYSNDRIDGGSADVKLIKRFLEDSNLEMRNYFFEELELLDPDVIITANLWDGTIDDKYLRLCFPEIVAVKTMDDVANYCTIKINGKEVHLIDLWHFSKPGSDKTKYYDPVVEYLYE